jgi:hypothetical protein
MTFHANQQIRSPMSRFSFRLPAIARSAVAALSQCAEAVGKTCEGFSRASPRGVGGSAAAAEPPASQAGMAARRW